MNYIEKNKSRIKLLLLAIAVVFLIFYFYTLTSLNNDWDYNKLNQIMLSMIRPSLENYFNKSSLIIWMKLKYVPTVVNNQKDETVLWYYKLNQTMLQ